MKRVLIVSPYFMPSNMVSSHRARLLALHLEEFGWKPSVLTVDPRYYEERLDPSLNAIVPAGMEVYRAWAFGTKPLRLIGDVGIRGFLGMLRLIGRVHKANKIDLLYITIPSNFAAPLGRLARALWKIPYGIDYQDPWVHSWPGTERVFSKAWWALRLAEWLEPWSVRRASLISGVAISYLDGVLSRNPGLGTQAVVTAVPFGWTEKDYEVVDRLSEPPQLFRGADRVHLIYAGAMLPKGYAVLERFLEGVALWRSAFPEDARRLKIWFVGTGKSPDDPQGHNVRPLIEKYGLSECADEHPARMSYLSVLNHLRHADGVLVLGSTEAHYTPSKCFQAVLSGRPVLAMLHEKSQAAELLRRTRSARCALFGDGWLPEPLRIKEALDEIFRGRVASGSVDRSVLEPYSARAAASVLARAMDEALGK